MGFNTFRAEHAAIFCFLYVDNLWDSGFIFYHTELLSRLSNALTYEYDRSSGVGLLRCPYSRTATLGSLWSLKPA